MVARYTGFSPASFVLAGVANLALVLRLSMAPVVLAASQPAGAVATPA